MAVKIVRKRRKNADGSYDIVHYETQAKAVWMSDGRSVEEAVTAGGGSSGGGVLVVTGEEDHTNRTVLNPSRTFAEIKAAHDAGQTVVLLLRYEENGATYYDRLPLVSYDDIGFSFSFSVETCTVSVRVDDSNRWSFYYYYVAVTDEENYSPIYAGSKNNAQNPNEYLLRNSKLSSTDSTPTVNGEICWTYG